MFAITKTQIFWWPVVVEKPDEAKPGTFARHVFHAQFEQLPVDEAEAERLHLETLDPAERNAVENNFTCRRLKNWRDVTDGPSGPELPFSPENLKSAWRDLRFRTALQVAYAQALNGEAARLGN